MSSPHQAQQDDNIYAGTPKQCHTALPTMRREAIQSSPESRLHRAQLNDPLGSCFGHVNRPIVPYRDIVNGVEHRIAGFPETDGRDNIPVAVELKDACVSDIVVGATYPEIKKRIGVSVDAEYSSRRL